MAWTFVAVGKLSEAHSVRESLVADLCYTLLQVVMLQDRDRQTGHASESKFFYWIIRRL